MPRVYTEIDGGFNNDDGMPRRIEWGVTRRGKRERGRISRLFANFSSVSRRFRSDSSSLGRVRVSRSWSLSGTGSSVVSRYILRRNSNRSGDGLGEVWLRCRRCCYCGSDYCGVVAG
ncbi:unnamed protein product [Fraxinus pennsylvanica]|uniref:DUF1117 domain-containing protein n=1 Tax=Fraxinus pennsylvanica TaxID=56036 RepID=A0AAD1Z7X1_9LAMI|nr:unnamed protein product [Fraxinus pennsylvanica]